MDQEVAATVAVLSAEAQSIMGLACDKVLEVERRVVVLEAERLEEVEEIEPERVK